MSIQSFIINFGMHDWIKVFLLVFKNFEIWVELTINISIPILYIFAILKFMEKLSIEIRFLLYKRVDHRFIYLIMEVFLELRRLLRLPIWISRIRIFFSGLWVHLILVGVCSILSINIITFISTSNSLIIFKIIMYHNRRKCFNITMTKLLLFTTSECHFTRDCLSSCAVCQWRGLLCNLVCFSFKTV